MGTKTIVLTRHSFYRMTSCGHDHCAKCNNKLVKSDIVIRKTGRAGKVRYYHKKCYEATWN